MTPRIAVVTPVYKHPEFAVEAVRSVIAQDAFPDTVTAISIDGCPFGSTRDLLQVFPATYPNIHLLTRVNGGPGAARNRAIDYLLGRYPSVDSVFFLDADNRLTPPALRRARERLLASDRGWLFPQIKTFGVEWSADYDIGYSSLAHSQVANLCDMGSMVRREILDGGVRFDEDRGNGFEDWDFWMQCVERGWRGEAATDFGLEYRRRAVSRFTVERLSEESAVEHIRRRHGWARSPRRVLEMEAEDAPRYFVNLGPGARFFAADPACLAGGSAAQPDAVEAYWRNRLHPRRRHFPRYQMHLTPAALAGLSAERLLHDAFRNIENLLDSHQVVRVALKPHPRVEAEAGAGDLGGPADIVGVCSNFFDECVDDASPEYFNSIAADRPSPRTCDVILGAPGFTAVRRASDPATDAARMAIGFLEEARGSKFANPLNRGEMAAHDPIFPPRRDYARVAREAVASAALRPHLRRDARPQVGLVVPFASYGGAERAGYALCRELARAGCATHLFVSGAPGVDAVEGFTDAFETVNLEWRGGLAQWGGGETYLGNDILLEEHNPESARRMLGMLGDLDLVIVNQAIAPHAVVPRLKRMGVRCAFYAHLSDLSPFGREVGHPAIAAAFEHAYDLYLTCSAALRDQMIGLGAPAEKVLHVENAAGFDLSPEQAENVERQRARGAAGRPLRALYLGRLDPQKGVDRLLDCMALRGARDQPVEWRVIGSELVTGGGGWAQRFADLGVAVSPPVYNPRAVADALEWADVLVLPSRWEGAPLVLFEAMRMGCVPIACDVGAVAEVVADGETGLLIPDGPDAETARALAAALDSLCEDRDRLRALALNGARRMRGHDWSVTAAELVRRVMGWMAKAPPPRGPA